MPLSPPPDNTKVHACAAIGGAIALCIFLLTRNNLPHVGDNIHSLPHGGRYRDGTKSITYCSPGRNFPSANLFAGGKFYAFIACLLLSLIIFTLTRRRESTCRYCQMVHTHF
ncbi:triple gene block protein 2 [Clivia carlavirus A]|uniref:Movement protein TGB2 n=1 Tax=Clivia carlavirus A TaxID=2838077 RepID=A0A8E7NEJ5_9VIRU|nr:triple gene block protein 2 [Clivia carlavirus A]QVY19180.1 triple gene block protein 2 [Clivia carlavirus A]